MCSNGGDRSANNWSLVGLGTCAPMVAIVLPIVGPWLVWVHVLQWQRPWLVWVLGTCSPMAAIVLPIVGL